MSLLKQLPTSMYVIKYKNGQYLGVPFHVRSKVMAFTKMDLAEIACNRIQKLKHVQIFYNPKRPSEFILGSCKKNKEISIHDLEMSKENRDVFVNYMINKNLSIHIIDKIIPMKHSNLKLYSSFLIEPALEENDKISFLNEQYDD